VRGTAAAHVRTMAPDVGAACDAPMCSGRLLNQVRFVCCWPVTRRPSSKLIRCCWSAGRQANGPGPRSEPPLSQRKHKKLGMAKGAYGRNRITVCKLGMAGSTSGRSCQGQCYKPAPYIIVDSQPVQTIAARVHCTPLEIASWTIWLTHMKRS
jgi:hypothetical protein